MSAKSTIGRTRAWLTDLGWTVDDCERAIPGTVRKRDLFSIFDQVAVKYGGPIMGVQVTDRTSVSKRRRKIYESDAFHLWRSAGGVVLLVGWRPSEIDAPGLIELIGDEQQLALVGRLRSA